MSHNKAHFSLFFKGGDFPKKILPFNRYLLKFSSKITEGQMFQTEAKINFFDCDPAGILFFGNFFKIAHAAYEELLKNGNLTRNYFSDNDYALPLVHSEGDFLKPLRPCESARLQVIVSLLKESSFELTFQIGNGAGQTCAIVKTVHVAVSRKNWKKTRIPEDLKEFLKQHLA